jgi:threonine dehydrogenase-like Zn-dependent dehydrogenase
VVLECVGMKESVMHAFHSARPGAMVGFVGVPHGVELNGEEMFYRPRGLMGGPAPVRQFLPHLADLVLKRKI